MDIRIQLLRNPFFAKPSKTDITLAMVIFAATMFFGLVL